MTSTTGGSNWSTTTTRSSRPAPPGDDRAALRRARAGDGGDSARRRPQGRPRHRRHGPPVPLPAWLAAIGAAVPAEESEDLGFVYHTRYFRPAAGQDPPPLTAVGAWHFDCYSLLTLPGDAGTWSMAIVITSRDAALKPLRAEANWTRLVSACPVHAPILAGEPVGTVMPVGGTADRLRRLVVGGTPAATGVLTVGDSWNCTNPSLRRGLTFGLMHAAITA